jgi:prefoldin subunit 5
MDNTQQSIQMLEARVKGLEKVVEAVQSLRNPVKHALANIDDIRHGNNVTSEEMWRACGHLDAALGTLRDIDKLIAQVAHESPAVQ